MLHRLATSRNVRGQLHLQSPIRIATLHCTLARSTRLAQPPVASVPRIQSISTQPSRHYSSEAMAQDHPEEGSTLTATFKVGPNDLASALSPDPTDDYAKVLATPKLVGFMEIVCARMLVPHMSKGQLSVGVRVEMDHLAATPEGEEVSVTAKFLRKEGKQLIFESVISDRGGDVGKGLCVRAVIDEKRLMQGAEKRMAKASKI